MKPLPHICLLSIFLFPMLILMSCTSAGEKDYRQAASHIQANNMAAYIEVLGSDSFMGRMPFTRGESLSIQYLAETFQDLGLEPAWQGFIKAQ